MMITRKPIGRRAMLRGMGTAMALPLLDAMVPSAQALEQGAGARKRLQVIDTPKGMMMQNWTRATTGEGYALTPILKPLEPYKDKFAVFSNLSHVQAEALGDGAGDHGRCCGGYLTGTPGKKNQRAHITPGPSMDPPGAQQVGEQNQIPPPEVGPGPPHPGGTRRFRHTP